MTSSHHPRSSPLISTLSYVRAGIDLPVPRLFRRSQSRKSGK